MSGNSELTDLASLIWNTSRADEGTISATGANIIAATLLAAGFRKQEPVSDLTEAEVEAAFKSWNGWHVGTVRDRLRAALVAARAVTNGDKQ